MFASGQLKEGEMYDVDHSRTGWGDYLKTKKKSPVNLSIYRTLCGERGIRTPGTSQYAGFQDRCIRPLCHLSKGCWLVETNKRDSKTETELIAILHVAEREGFEPPVPLSTPVFKTGAFDHSAISPMFGCR